MRDALSTLAIKGGFSQADAVEGRELLALNGVREAAREAAESMVKGIVDWLSDPKDPNHVSRNEAIDLLFGFGVGATMAVANPKYAAVLLATLRIVSGDEDPGFDEAVEDLIRQMNIERAKNAPPVIAAVDAAKA